MSDSASGASRRLVFMGTPEFAVPTLRALMDGPDPVVGVYTRPDKPAGRGRGLSASPVKRLALAGGLPVYQPRSFKDPEEVEGFRSLNPDVAVVAAYGLILPRTLLGVPPFGILNVHPSLLPRHRGPSPVASAILEGDQVTGVTIMLVEPKVDSGPILSQREMAVDPVDTTGILSEKLARMSADLLMETLPRWLDGEIKPRPQDDSGATYSRMITKADGEIDWRLPAEVIWRRVRAFDPWPGAYTTWKGKGLKILRAEPLGERGPELVEGKIEAQVGQVVMPGKGQVGVGAGHGVLLLCRVQLEGRKATDAASFVLGHRDLVGSTLPS